MGVSHITFEFSGCEFQFYFKAMSATNKDQIKAFV